MPANDPKKLLSITQKRHPKYNSMNTHWEFMESCYLGGREWFKKNVFKYHKEGDLEYGNRVERAYRFNHTRECVDLVNKYLFRSPVLRNVDDAPESVKAFWSNANRKGIDINEFAKTISTKSSIFGRPWIIVDSTASGSTEAVRTLADDEDDEGDSSVYAYVVPPMDVLDMSWDEKGDLNWIVVRELHRDDENPWDDEREPFFRYRLWTRNEWYLIEVSIKGRNPSRASLVGSGEHGLGEVPAIPADNIASDDHWSSPALINDIAYLDRACANYASNLDAIIQDQTFSQLAMPAQNILPGEESYEKILELGTKRIFLYDGESGRGPEFIAPDPRQAQLIISAIQQLINEIYHSIGLAGERTKQDNSQGIDNSSGVAKSKDFERVNALLISKSDALEHIENSLVRLVCLWSGDEPPKQDLVEYPDSFDVRGLYDEFDIANQLNTVQAPESMRSEQMKAVLKKLFPSLGKELKAKMLADIDRWESELVEAKELQKQQQEQALESAAMNQAAQNESPSKTKEEASRNRNASGKKQSATKERQEKRQKEGQEKGRRNSK